jgi:PD-(D/E)XK endonuclease
MDTLLAVLTTNQKGANAEAAIALEAAKLGIGVYRPLGDERYDLILDVRPRLLRVQCKWARRSKDVILVPLYSARRAREGLRRTFYSSDEVDAFAAYSDATNRCYFFGFEDLAASEMRLRIGPTRNNQAKRVRWAKDYEFAARLTALVGR